MNSNRITHRLTGQAPDIEAVRQRQTARPTSPFRQVLATGSNVLLAGAEAATGAVGMPRLSAAITSARLGADAALGAGLGRSVHALSAGGATPEAGSPLDLQSAQSQRYQNELQLLQMQAQIQDHNRQITLVSNVMKAEHETKKAAITNMRS